LTVIQALKPPFQSRAIKLSDVLLIGGVEATEERTLPGFRVPARGTRAWRASFLLRRIKERQKYADLHVHTRISDGFFAPEEAVEQARKAGIAAICITDHDSITGVEGALWAGQRWGVEAIPGVELSSQFEDKELHIIGYYIDWRKEWFRDRLLKLQEDRRERVKKMVDKLNELGVKISYNLVISLDGGVIGRPHIAMAMVEQGYAKTMQEVFDKYIGFGKPAYAGRYPLTPFEAIEMIRRVGGVPVLAHPIYARADDMLPELVEHGLRGIEVYHSRHDASTTKHYRRLAKKYDLLITGGSDAHGMEVPVGSVRVPYSYVEKLKEEVARG
jgi:predicted metal-dependent phosphoesterase TrpH